MTAEFGPRLRRERDRRKISLESISANTKVSIGLFEALERDDVSRWPSGIFRRSFMRAYADAIGIDADEAVREFLERFPDPADLPAEPAATDGLHGRAAGLRLTLADTWMPFTGGPLLSALAKRSAAIAFDAGVITIVGVSLFLILGEFWTPMGVFMACYYWGGILILGNTPGVCLQAPGPDDGDAPRGSSSPPRRLTLDAIRARFARPRAA
jgi:transcriptional regulator with XRE-family HTH domain